MSPESYVPPPSPDPFASPPTPEPSVPLPMPDMFTLPPTPIQSSLPPPPPDLPMPPSTQDEHADDVLASAANAGGFWIVLSVIAFGAAIFMPTPAAFGVASLIGFVLFVIGMVRRRQGRRRMLTTVDPAALKRARWRRWARTEPGVDPARVRSAVFVSVVVALVVMISTFAR